MGNSRLVIMALALGGCLADEPDVDSTEAAVVGANGVSMNGVSMNGVSMNGVSMNGVSMNGVSMNGVSMNGVSMNGVSMNGTTLTGTNTAGATISGASVGALFKANLSNGTTMTLRIDGAAKLAAPNADTWSYNVSFSADGGWKPLCGTGIAALVVPGIWDMRAGVPGGGGYSQPANAFTFACRAATIAKCVEMGYKPALGRTAQMLSCVRLLRGDFCGDGSTWTVTGNQVNIYDGIGVQADTMAWDIEAEWQPSGARCISAKKETRFYTSGLSKPPCLTAKTLPVNTLCGTQGFTNAVLINEIPPASN